MDRKLEAARRQRQVRSAALSTAEIGVIDIRQAIMSTAEGKLASAELHSQFAPRQRNWKPSASKSMSCAGGWRPADTQG